MKMSTVPIGYNCIDLSVLFWLIFSPLQRLLRASAIATLVGKQTLIVITQWSASFLRNFDGRGGGRRPMAVAIAFKLLPAMSASECVIHFSLHSFRDVRSTIPFGRHQSRTSSAMA